MFIKLKSDRANADNKEPVLINPKYIIRISVAANGSTVIEVEGSEYSSWVKETPNEVYRLINKLAKS